MYGLSGPIFHWKKLLVGDSASMQYLEMNRFSMFHTFVLLKLEKLSKSGIPFFLFRLVMRRRRKSTIQPKYFRFLLSNNNSFGEEGSGEHMYLHAH